MSTDTLIRRLQAANPDPEPAHIPGAGDIFEQIVAGPGDPRLTVRSDRSARRSSAGRRPSTVRRAVPVLGLSVAVVAGVGVIVAGAGGSSSQLTPAGQGRLTVSGVNAKETAVIVRRARGRLTAAGGGALVSETSWTTDLKGSPSGPTVAWTWTDPQSGVTYQRITIDDPGNGNPLQTNWTESSQTATRPNGQVVDSGNTVQINYPARTYSKTTMQLVYSPGPASIPTVDSSAADIAAALSSGTVSQTGTTTINGVSAIVLSVTGSAGLTLDVNAQTDQPMRAEFTNPADPSGETIVTDLVPASDTNVAQAREAGVPAGFTETTQP